MKLAEFERIRSKHVAAANAYFIALQDPDTDPVFLRYLQSVAEKTEAEYLQAFTIMQSEAKQQ